MKPTALIYGISLSILLTGCQSTSHRPTLPLYTSLTDEDVRLADNSLQHSLNTLPSNQQGRWHNAISSNSGSITPLRTYKSKTGYYCRDYKEQIRISKRQATYSETACRSSNGNWYPI